MRFANGLVVGKFSPLHKGHQLVIDCALRHCDGVVIISYSKPEFSGCDATTRAQWLAQLYPECTSLVVDDRWIARWNSDHPHNPCPFAALPHNDADAHIHRDFTGWLCAEVLKTTVDAVFSSETYGEPLATHLADYFARAGFGSVAVRAIMVDGKRQRVPTSGTVIRDAPHAHQAMLDDRVRFSGSRYIAILGGESSGKSSLTLALAQHLNGVAVEEYGRTLWEERQGALLHDDLLTIAQTQVAMEEAAAVCGKQWVICDTTPLTTLFYSLDMFGKAHPVLEALAQRRYDFIFLCAPDFDFVQDGTRRDAAFRGRQHGWFQKELRVRNMDYAEVTGSLESRVEQVKQSINFDA